MLRHFLCFFFLTGCAAEQYTSVYAISDTAPSLSADAIEDLEGAIEWIDSKKNLPDPSRLELPR